MDQSDLCLFIWASIEWFLCEVLGESQHIDAKVWMLLFVYEPRCISEDSSDLICNQSLKAPGSSVKKKAASVLLSILPAFLLFYLLLLPYLASLSASFVLFLSLLSSVDFPLSVIKSITNTHLSGLEAFSYGGKEII